MCFSFFFLISDHPTVDNATRRVRHERGGFNATPPVFDVFEVVSTPPHSFSTAFDATRVREGGTPPCRKWASKVCPPIFFLFVLSNPPPKLQHTDATRRVEPFSSCFCYSHSTRREGVYSSCRVSSIHTDVMGGGCPLLFSSCFFYPQRHDVKGVYPLVITFIFMHAMRTSSSNYNN